MVARRVSISTVVGAGIGGLLAGVALTQWLHVVASSTVLWVVGALLSLGLFLCATAFAKRPGPARFVVVLLVGCASMMYLLSLLVAPSAIPPDANLAVFMVGVGRLLCDGWLAIAIPVGIVLITAWRAGEIGSRDTMSLVNPQTVVIGISMISASLGLTVLLIVLRVAPPPLELL